jgi:hypothetical protein
MPGKHPELLFHASSWLRLATGRAIAGDDSVDSCLKRDRQQPSPHNGHLPRAPAGSGVPTHSSPLRTPPSVQ